MSWRDIPSLYEAGQVATVVELAQVAGDEHPGAGQAMRPYVAMALHDLGRYSEAEAVYLELREAANPEGAALYESQLGRMFEQAGRLTESEEWYRRATETYPADAARFVMLGGFLVKQGRWEEAEVIHRRATLCEEGPVDEAWLNLGIVLRCVGRYDEAAFAFRQALTRDPKYADAEEGLRDVTEAMRLKHDGEGNAPS